MVAGPLPRYTTTMADGETGAAEGRRLKGEERREAILAAAGRALADQGFLPLPYEAIAREAGISKALIYAHFATQASLYNALLEQRLGELAGELALVSRGDFETAAVGAALAYFDEAAERGPMLNVLLTDGYLDGERSAPARALRDQLWRRFVRASRAYVRLPAHERVAALAMILAIPEDLGRLVYRGEMEASRARTLCGDLVRSAVRGLRDAQS